MIAFVVLQILINVALGLFVIWWVFMRQKTERLPDGILKFTVSKLEKQSEQYAVELSQYRTRMEAQLRSLARVCEKVTSVLRSSRVENEDLSESAEAKELASILTPSTKQIPTLTEVSQAKDRLAKEAKLELRSILGSQLS